MLLEDKEGEFKAGGKWFQKGSIGTVPLKEVSMSAMCYDSANSCDCKHRGG